MFPCATSPAMHRHPASRGIFAIRRGFRAWPLAAAAALAVCALAALPLRAQTAHFSPAVVTLGSGFVTPTGVTVDGNGNVYVTDNGNSAIKEILAVNGTIPATNPTINTLGSGFSNPFTAAVDGSGNVYVADYGNKQVKEMVAVNGSIPASPTINVLGSGYSFIFGTAVDDSGDVFVTDYGHNAVKEILAVKGVIPASPTIDVLGSGFNIPAGLAVDVSGNVYVGDQNNNVVKEILASSGYTTVNIVATGFNTPDGIAIDGSGNIFVADDGNNLVKEIVAVNGSIPANPTILTLPGSYNETFDVAVDLSGNVYVADRADNAVKEIPLGGVNFGAVNVGASASPMPVTFTFDTAGTLGLTAVLTQGVPLLDFTDAGADTCTASTFYSAGQSCTVNVTFKPIAPGVRNGVVELLNLSGSVLATANVLGIGVGPQVTFATNASGLAMPSTVFPPLGGGFSSPGGVAVDASGNVFVADSGNNAVKEIFAAGGWTTVTPRASGFNSPNGVALDGSGNVYVADTFNNEVKEIVAAGGYTTVNSIGAGFLNPYAVAVDSIGNVYVADYSNGAVKEIMAVDGSIPASAAVRTLASGLSGPDGVAVDASGNVFVANYNDSTIHEILAVTGSIPASPTIKTIGSGFSGPSNLAVDGAGNLFVADSNSGAVKEILAAGGYTTIVTLGGGFSSPEAVAVNRSGDVIVADAGASSVSWMDYADAPALTFANTTVGLTSSDSPQTVTVSNDGNAPLIFPLPASGSSPSVSANFAWAPSSTCRQTTPSSSAPFELAGGTSCTMALEFEPAAIGSIGGLAKWTDNNLNQAGAVQSIQLLGTGTAPPPPALSATSLAFGNEPVGGATASQSVTMTNNGLAPLSIASIVLTGTNASSFAFSNNCGTSLAAGAHCTIHGHFAPAALGAMTAAVTIGDDASNSPQTIALSGSGISGTPAAELSTTSLSFPGTKVATASASQSVTLTNTGTGAMSIAGIAVNGANASSFAFSNNCGTSLAAGARCSIHGHFAPTATGPLVAAITITDNAPGSPQKIDLSGTGGTQAAQLLVTSLIFPATKVGTTSSSQSVTLTNTGGAALSIAGIAMTGANPTSFVFANNCGTSLAAGASCSIHGHFAPTATGSLTAAITITDNAPGSPQSITLSGTGQ